MPENQRLLRELSDMLCWKRSTFFYAQKLKITEEAVRELKRTLKKYRKEGININNISDTPKALSSSKKINIDKGTLESVQDTTFEPKDHLQLAELHHVDLNIYKITNYWTKLQPNGNFTSSLFASLIKKSEFNGETFSKFLENYKSKHTPIPICRLDSSKETVDVELSMFDYHLAKKHIDNNDNDLEERALNYYHTAQALIHKVRKVYNIRKIIYPISNDFFHSDNILNQTTKGTPQDVLLNYNDEYELGFAITSDTIKMLKYNCEELEVILVQGNHDRTKSFYLAHALEVYFSKEKNIKFDRKHNIIKACVIGNTFIGYHHGNCKLEDLPLLFATDPVFGKQFGDAKYREIHTGDKHHYMTKEVKGVRIQQMPSLTGTDAWHKDNNFVNNIRAALVLIYDSNKGKIGEFEERL